MFRITNIIFKKFDGLIVLDVATYFRATIICGFNQVNVWQNQYNVVK